MKKHPAQRKGLPRPALAMIYTFTICLLMAIALIAIHFPIPTPETQFRRLEQGNMVGPARILGKETVSENGERLLIAASDTQLMLYRYKEDEFSPFADKDKLSTDLVCRKKHGNLTILAAGGRKPHFSSSHEFNLPIILFDAYPQAVRAEVEISFPLDTWDEINLLLHSNRSHEGYFYFSIHCPIGEDQRYISDLERLAAISAGYSFNYYHPVPVPATIRLYDANDRLVVDEVIYFRTIEEDLLQD